MWAGVLAYHVANMCRSSAVAIPGHLRCAACKPMCIPARLLHNTCASALVDVAIVFISAVEHTTHLCFDFNADPFVPRRMRPRFAAATVHSIIPHNAVRLLSSLTARSSHLYLATVQASCTSQLQTLCLSVQGPNKFAVGLFGALAAAQIALIPTGQYSCCWLCIYSLHNVKLPITA